LNIFNRGPSKEIRIVISLRPSSSYHNFAPFCCSLPLWRTLLLGTSMIPFFSNPTHPLYTVSALNPYRVSLNAQLLPINLISLPFSSRLFFGLKKFGNIASSFFVELITYMCFVCFYV